MTRRPEDGAGLDASFEELVAKYGRDNAEYLWEVRSSWVNYYTHATHIDTGLGDSEGYRQYARSVAGERSWQFEEVPGDLALLQALMDGDWEERDSLIVPPGRRIAPSVRDEIVVAGD